MDQEMADTEEAINLGPNLYLPTKENFKSGVLKTIAFEP